MDSNATLSWKEQNFVTVMLASGENVSVAARTCGINTATAYRWLQRPQVQEALQTARTKIMNELWNEAMEQLRASAPLAVEVLRKHANAKVRATPGTQIRAAQLILDILRESDKIEQLEQEVEALKQSLQANDTWQH